MRNVTVEFLNFWHEMEVPLMANAHDIKVAACAWFDVDEQLVDLYGHLPNGSITAVEGLTVPWQQVFSLKRKGG